MEYRAVALLSAYGKNIVRVYISIKLFTPREEIHGVFLLKKILRKSVDKYNLIVYNQNNLDELHAIKFETIEKERN